MHANNKVDKKYTYANFAGRNASPVPVSVVARELYQGNPHLHASLGDMVK